MKTYKIIISPILISLTFLVLSSGQALAHPEGGKGRNLDKVKEELNLSDDQAAKVHALMQQVRGACEDAEGRREKRKCMRKERKKVEGSFEKILDKKQLAKFKKVKKERKEKRKGKRIAKLKKNLDLNDGQAKKLEKLFESNRGKCKDAEDKKACRKKNKQSMKGEISKILSDEQMEKFKEMKRKRKEGRERRYFEQD